MLGVKLKSRCSRRAEMVMGLFRIFRPITIEARQCRKAETIATDLGFANIMPGDWVISGEDGERYSLSDDCFHRTFEPVAEEQLSRQSEISNSAASPQVSGRGQVLPMHTEQRG